MSPRAHAWRSCVRSCGAMEMAPHSNPPYLSDPSISLVWIGRFDMRGIRAFGCAALVLCLTVPVSVQQPDHPGIYKVGFTSFVVSDASRGRSIPISVFYPVSPSGVDSSSAPATYPRDPVNRPGESLSSTLFVPLGVDPAY